MKNKIGIGVGTAYETSKKTKNVRLMVVMCGCPKADFIYAFCLN